VKEAFDEDGKLIDPKIVERLERVVLSTLENSKKLS
jgi:hypothetical protein